ncbi:chemotaxis protein CheW [Falsiroseomonas stagni]|uniref:Purine-binding chemotaxis protein CheW n=1 Tax=Falsiroseomonas stagni DSM 19981 TaxID=1123062 RepID=A0A1I4E4Q5_9PROT|nr:chemotaxis protein CheW [Falsiroseomonas stagni]SFL00732.1 purine-binding chemotaxis protein CheW [Falsiroseomonas stagni DSM 19981]
MTRDILSDSAIDVLTLGIGGEIFAIEAADVREILDLVPITAVPGARSFVGGVVNVRGRIVPLADLRVQFGMAVTAPTPDTRIIVLELDLEGEPTPVGILADRVFEVTQIVPASLEAAPRIGIRWRPEFIRGIGMRGDDLLILPNLSQILH